MAKGILKCWLAKTWLYLYLVNALLLSVLIRYISDETSNVWQLRSIHVTYWWIIYACLSIAFQSHNMFRLVHRFVEKITRSNAGRIDTFLLFVAVLSWFLNCPPEEMIEALEKRNDTRS